MKLKKVNVTENVHQYTSQMVKKKKVSQKVTIALVNWIEEMHFCLQATSLYSTFPNCQWYLQLFGKCMFLHHASAPNINFTGAGTGTDSFISFLFFCILFLKL